MGEMSQDVWIISFGFRARLCNVLTAELTDGMSWNILAQGERSTSS